MSVQYAYEQPYYIDNSKYFVLNGSENHKKIKKNNIKVRQNEMDLTFTILSDKRSKTRRSADLENN